MKIHYRRNLGAALCFFGTVGASVVFMVAAIPPGNARPQMPGLTLRISLFPYVPNPKLIEDTVTKYWKANPAHAHVSLQLVYRKQFDSYAQDPPEDLDVFEFDAIGLEYYVRNNFVRPLSLEDVQESADILDFAWKGSMVDGRVYGVPRLACTYVLIYRKDDQSMADAVGLQGLYKAGRTHQTPRQLLRQA